MEKFSKAIYYFLFSLIISLILVIFSLRIDKNFNITSNNKDYKEILKIIPIFINVNKEINQNYNLNVKKSLNSLCFEIILTINQINITKNYLHDNYQNNSYLKITLDFFSFFKKNNEFIEVYGNKLDLKINKENIAFLQNIIKNKLYTNGHQTNNINIKFILSNISFFFNDLNISINNNILDNTNISDEYSVNNKLNIFFPKILIKKELNNIIINKTKVFLNNADSIFNADIKYNNNNINLKINLKNTNLALLNNYLIKYFNTILSGKTDINLLIKYNFIDKKLESDIQNQNNKISVNFNASNIKIINNSSLLTINTIPFSLNLDCESECSIINIVLIPLYINNELAFKNIAIKAKYYIKSRVIKGFINNKTNNYFNNDIIPISFFLNKNNYNLSYLLSNIDTFLSIEDKDQKNFYKKNINIDNNIKLNQSNVLFYYKDKLNSNYLNIEHIIKIWPKNLLPDLRLWIDKNIKSGYINTINFDFDFNTHDFTIKCDIVDYMMNLFAKNLKSLTSSRAELIINNNKIRLYSSKVFLQNDNKDTISLSNVEIDISNLKKIPSKLLKVKAKINEKAEYLIYFLQDMWKINKSDFSLKNGLISGEINFSIPLKQELSFSDIKINSNGIIENINVIKYLNLKNIENLKLKTKELEIKSKKISFQITDNKFIFFGKIAINDIIIENLVVDFLFNDFFHKHKKKVYFNLKSPKKILKFIFPKIDHFDKIFDNNSGMIVGKYISEANKENIEIFINTDEFSDKILKNFGKNPIFFIKIQKKINEKIDIISNIKKDKINQDYQDNKKIKSWNIDTLLFESSNFSIIGTGSIINDEKTIETCLFHQKEFSFKEKLKKIKEIFEQKPFILETQNLKLIQYYTKNIDILFNIHDYQNKSLNVSNIEDNNELQFENYNFNEKFITNKEIRLLIENSNDKYNIKLHIPYLDFSNINFKNLFKLYKYNNLQTNNHQYINILFTSDFIRGNFNKNLQNFYLNIKKHPNKELILLINSDLSYSSQFNSSFFKNKNIESVKNNIIQNYENINEILEKKNGYLSIFYSYPVASFVSNNIGHFFQFGGFNNDISNGQIEIKSSFEDNSYKGFVKLDKISWVNAPSVSNLLKLVSISSIFSSLHQILGGKGLYIDHSLCSLDYNPQSEIIKLEDCIISGPSLYSDFDASYKINTEELYIEGIITPHHFFHSTILTLGIFFPKLRKILLHRDKNIKNFIYEQKVNGVTNFTVRPLSMIVPWFFGGLFNIRDMNSQITVPISRNHTYNSD
ncbi:hypothetical protein [Lyticum sinuosum]|uniref:DUF3971-domain containing protein n=1 Tax=Lyticum sinuosum TaxID=1332059 RepID=A0AAE4VJ12_9RICK|nr:hypothetical protein [Lyticum sinuosum]MDZ5760915.1 putative DUF3971-domain containing protein [Lyticum sinuosum]